jgi:16S rRNA G966 N2-methylase RsmD
MKTDSLADRVFPDLSAELRKQVKYDWPSIYSTSSRKAADLISNILSNYVSTDSTITDATSGIGGNTISLSKKFKRVHSVELDQTRFMYLCHNLNLYGCNNVIYYNANYLNVCWSLEQDAVLIDPPWGGASVYWDKKPRIYLSNVPIEYVVQRLLERVKVVAIKVPTNFDVVSLRQLLTHYRVHHYKLRKMHLIVCSHNPKYIKQPDVSKGGNLEPKMQYSEILNSQNRGGFPKKGKK